MTTFADADHPAVKQFAESVTEGAQTDKERAVALFHAVRDGIWYDPYLASEDPEDYRASAVLAAGRAYCIPKAVLLCAAGRAAGIESQLGFADVRNHLNTEKLRARMGDLDDVFPWHGYALFKLDGRWVKATPAFNAELCERFGVTPLEFDGEHDALLQPYTDDGRTYMEYVRDRGVYDDLPFDEIMADLRAMAFEFASGEKPDDEKFA